MGPLVSIITPTFNHVPYIERCVRSVLEQTYSRWELTIIDDASTDGTAEVARDLARRDPRVSVIVHPSRWGAEHLHATYNEALKRSSGEYVAVLEGDDWWTPDRLALQVPQLADDASVVLCYADAWETSPDGRPVIYEAARISQGSLRSSFPDCVEYFSSLTSVPANTVLVRRAALERAGGFQSAVGLPLVDYPTWLTLSLAGDFVRVPEPLAYWRRHSSSVYGGNLERVALGCHTYFLAFVDRNRAAIERAGLSPGRLEREASVALDRTRRSLAYFGGRYDLVRGDRPGARRKMLQAIVDPHTFPRYRVAALVGLVAASSTPKLLGSVLTARRLSRRRVLGTRTSCARIRSNEPRNQRRGTHLRVNRRRPGHARPSVASMRPDCVHVFLDDAGGGPGHARLLQEAMGDRVAWQSCAVDPTSVTFPSLGWAGAARTIAHAVRGRSTIIHAHGVRAAAACLPAAMFRRARLVVTIHGLHSLRRSTRKSGLWLSRLALWRADRVIVLSSSDRSALIHARLAPAARVVSVRGAFRDPRRIDRRRARIGLNVPDGTLTVVWLGRLSREKSPSTFVSAIHAAAEQINVIGLMGGDGPLRPDVESSIANATAPSLVKMLGWLEDPGELLSAADIFVSTSEWEGLPLSVLEAASVGLPLVLTDVPGNRDLKDAGVPSVLVPAGDPDALAGAILELAANPDRRSAMGTEAADTVRQVFTPQALAEDVLAVYRELAEHRGVRLGAPVP
jgi:glycosyltransferase involved in cell wall biosynthesis/GT2 family glycosyltransferase